MPRLMVWDWALVKMHKRMKYRTAIFDFLGNPFFVNIFSGAIKIGLFNQPPTKVISQTALPTFCVNGDS